MLRNFPIGWFNRGKNIPPSRRSVAEHSGAHRRLVLHLDGWLGPWVAVVVETSGGGQAACALANGPDKNMTMAYMLDMIYHDNHVFFLGYNEV